LAKDAARVTSDDPSSLMDALKRRDRAAWNAVVDRHLGEIYGFVFHLVGGNRTAAEDLNQETWLEAIGNIGRCDPSRGNFRNWLFGIARRRVALHFRRCVLKANPVLLGGQVADTADREDISLLPEDVLEQVERMSAVRAAMLVLAEDRRKAILWKYAEGLSVEAIAARTGKTTKAIESLLSRARQQLRELLSGYVTTSDVKET
jgi:RNA polymerase sigma-70 factor, ECF subfamily